MHWLLLGVSSPAIGFGHVSRLRLLQDAIESTVPAAETRLVVHEPHSDPTSAAFLLELSQARKPTVVVVDGPDEFVDAVSQHVSLRQPGVLVAAFRMYGVEAVDHPSERVSLVPSFTPTQLTKRDEGAHFTYSGGRLILVRPSLYFGSGDAKAEPPRVLITMGSADPAGLTTLAAESLRGLQHQYQVVVVLGNLNNRADQLAERYSDTFDVVRQGNIDFDQMLKSASYAIVSGGLTRYECVAAQVPFVSISLNMQQAQYTSAVTSAGFGVHAGVLGSITAAEVRTEFLHLASDPQLTAEMRERARGMIPADNAVALVRFLEAAAHGVWSAR